MCIYLYNIDTSMLILYLNMYYFVQTYSNSEVALEAEIILEKNKQYLKKLYFWWLEYFDTWNLSDYDENDLIAFIEDLEKHNDFDEEIKMMKMYLRLAKRD